jgi:DNA-binding phage protein
MLMLELIGVLPKFRTFSHALPTDLGEVLARTGEDWLEELRDLAIETGRRPDIERLITRTLRRLRRRRGMALIARNVAGLDRLLGMTRPHPERP